MQIGVADHIWTIGELVNSALNVAPMVSGRKVGQFVVIDGGREN
jgi:hypothetical protein